MNTIVLRKGSKDKLDVSETVLKTLRQFSSASNGMFQDEAVAKAITAQGWNIAPYQVSTSISLLVRKGYHICATGTGGWYTFDARIRVGKVSAILAVSIACPVCGGFCDNEKGSSMIDGQDTLVTCEDCGQKCKVPTNAFRAKES